MRSHCFFFLLLLFSRLACQIETIFTRNKEDHANATATTTTIVIMLLKIMWEKIQKNIYICVQTGRLHRNRMWIQKHNATLSPRLNWKLQRINNVRLFDSISFRLLRTFFASFFLCPSHSLSLSVVLPLCSYSGLFLLQNNYNTSGFCVHYWMPRKNKPIRVWVGKIMPNWNWNEKQFMRFVKFLCDREF